MAVNELEIIGTRSGGRQDTAEALQHVARANWVPIVSDQFPIESANEALAFMRTGQAAGRIVLLHNLNG
jgi:D-arabinose 1-dehydrogenase-like Zn-dependent alcohol dehydrogenase